MRTGTRRFTSTSALVVLGLASVLAAGCDKVQLTAPPSSTISLSSSVRSLPTGGSTELSAVVTESAGTPVQNGTTVRFSTNLGRVEPAEVQTRNGMATTTFFAGDVSGAAEVKATSGGIGAPSGNATATNAVTILVGAAAVDAVTVRSSAGSVPATGGTVDVIATVTGGGGTVGSTTVAGSPMGGVPVTFSTTAGSLSSTRVTTDGNGEAVTRLTTDANATVTATAGTKSGTVAIQALNPVATPTLTLTAQAGAATAVAQLWTFTATVANNAAVGSPVQFEWNFGDGVTQSSTSATATHAYTTSGRVYTASVVVRFANGTSVSAQTDIVTEFP